MISLLLTFAAVSKLACALHYTDDIAAQKDMWEEYKNEYNRKYTDEAEEKMRFGFFLENIKNADAHQAVA